MGNLVEGCRDIQDNEYTDVLVCLTSSHKTLTSACILRSLHFKSMAVFHVCELISFVFVGINEGKI